MKIFYQKIRSRCFFTLFFAGSMCQLYSQASTNSYCSINIGPGSELSGFYEFHVAEDQSYAYHDHENEQFVIEIHGENFMDAMLIIERLDTGRHDISMEMQVSIEMSTNDGEDYFIFNNYQENGGGYIQIDRLDEPDGIVSGSFSGTFSDGATHEDRSIQLDGRFAVSR